jgi:hypothetical protein
MSSRRLNFSSAHVGRAALPRRAPWQKLRARAIFVRVVAATDCRSGPKRPHPLGLAPRAVGTAHKTRLSLRPASPSRTGRSPDLHATCHAPPQAIVPPPRKNHWPRHHRVGPRPRTLDPTCARASAPSSYTRIGVKDKKCQMEDKVPGRRDAAVLTAHRPAVAHARIVTPSFSSRTAASPR